MIKCFTDDLISSSNEPILKSVFLSKKLGYNRKSISSIRAAFKKQCRRMYHSSMKDSMKIRHDNESYSLKGINRQEKQYIDRFTQTDDKVSFSSFITQSDCIKLDKSTQTKPIDLDKEEISISLYNLGIDIY